MFPSCPSQDELGFQRLRHHSIRQLLPLSLVRVNGPLEDPGGIKLPPCTAGQHTGPTGHVLEPLVFNDMGKKPWPAPNHLAGPDWNGGLLPETYANGARGAQGRTPHPQPGAQTSSERSREWAVRMVQRPDSRWQLAVPSSTWTSNTRLQTLIPRRKSHLRSYPARTSRGTAACEAVAPSGPVHSILLALL